MRAVRGLVTLVLLASLGVPACGSAPHAQVDGARMLARVAKQVEAGPRIPGSPGHVIVRDWIAAELTRMGATVERQRFIDSTLAMPLPLENVIGRFGPRPPPAGRVLVLAAHYDPRPWSDQEPDTTLHAEPIAGANDGGSGVAVLLEVAELMSRRPPAVAVDLVFFDGEDQGRPTQPQEYSLGARGYAARLGTERPTAAFVFDMVGDRDLNIHPEQRSAEQAANLVELVLAGARATGARGFHSQPRHRITDDHVPLLDAGVPAVDIIDFDYDAWHTRRDGVDQVSAASLAEVARVAAWLVYSSPLARIR